MQSIINEHREAKSSATQGQGEEVADDLVDVLMKEEFGLSDNSIKAVILVRVLTFSISVICLVESNEQFTSSLW